MLTDQKITYLWIVIKYDEHIEEINKMKERESKSRSKMTKEDVERWEDRWEHKKRKADRIGNGNEVGNNNEREREIDRTKIYKEESRGNDKEDESKIRRAAGLFHFTLTYTSCWPRNDYKCPLRDLHERPPSSSLPVCLLACLAYLPACLPPSYWPERDRESERK